MAYSRAAKRLGARIQTETEITGFILEDGAVQGVHTTKGDYYADVVVNACGSWAGQVARACRAGSPHQAAQRAACRHRAVGRFMKATIQCARYNVVKFRPETITDETVLRLGASLSIEQTETGGMIIGGTREFVGYEEQNTFEAIDVMMKRAARFFPALKDVSVIRFFTGFRPYTPDGMPLLGRSRPCRASTWPPDTRATALRFPRSPASCSPSRSFTGRARTTSTHLARTASEGEWRRLSLKK